MEYNTMKYIVARPGKADRDILMSCALAVRHFRCEVRRKKPTEEEFNDQYVVVLGIGERHEPELMNFDHHQLGRDDECTLSLLADHLGIEEGFNLQEWYEATIMLASQGPEQTAHDLHLPRFPHELMSPLEDFLLETFDSCDEVESYEFLHIFGNWLTKKVKKAAEDRNKLAGYTKVHWVCGIEVLVHNCAPSKYAAQVREEMAPYAAVSVSHDPCGLGWNLCRWDVHPGVDFRKLEDDPRIRDVLQDGSAARIYKRLPIEEVLELVKKSFL